jgi:hypothetical protein
MSISSTGIYGNTSILNSEIYTDLIDDINNIKQDIEDISNNRIKDIEENITDLSDNRIKDIEDNITDLSDNCIKDKRQKLRCLLLRRKKKNIFYLFMK